LYPLTNHTILSFCLVTDLANNELFYSLYFEEYFETAATGPLLNMADSQARLNPVH